MTQVKGCFPENIESGKHVPIIPNPFTLQIHNTRMASLWKTEKANIIGKGKHGRKMQWEIMEHREKQWT